MSTRRGGRDEAGGATFGAMLTLGDTQEVPLGDLWGLWGASSLHEETRMVF